MPDPRAAVASVVTPAAAAPSQAQKPKTAQPTTPTVIKHTQYCFVSVGGTKTKTGEVEVNDPNSDEQKTLCRTINVAYAAKMGLGQHTGHSMDNKTH